MSLGTLREEALCHGSCVCDRAGHLRLAVLQCSSESYFQANRNIKIVDS